MNISSYIYDKEKNNYYKISFYIVNPLNKIRNYIWLSNNHDEGMEINEPELFKIIDKYFKENF